MNERCAFLVCQKPFTTKSDSPSVGGHYTFCKLAPLFYQDGQPTLREDFPNDGEVWWMLINHTRPLAQPGILVMADIEDSVSPDRTSPTTSMKQAVRETVKRLGAETGYSLITLEAFSGTKLEQIVDGTFSSVENYQPTERVFVRCQGRVLGPLKADSVAHPQGWQLSFQTASNDKTVFCVPEDEFTDIVGSEIAWFHEEIAMDSSHRSESKNRRTVAGELLLSAGYSKLLESRPNTLLLESTSEKIARIASRLGVSRSKKQQLRALLDELDLNRAQSDSREEYESVITEVRQDLDAYENSLNAISEAFLKSGLFGDDRIRKAEERIARQYVERQKATLDSEIQEQISQLQKEQTELEKVVKQLKQEETDQKKRARDLAAKALKEERETLEQEVREREARIQSELSELKTLQDTIQGSLADVAAEMKENGDGIVKRYLSLAPLLGMLPVGDEQGAAGESSSARQENHLGTAQHFEFPPYLSSSSSGRLEKEQEFVARFENLVEESGLAYRQIDLRRFHISAKTGAGGFVVLGGPSGTGKSTLPQLYGRALLGDAFGEEDGGTDCLMVSVSPGWMDSKDVMGYVNSIDMRFHPSESGLYIALLHAEHENQNKERTAPIRIICFDEMNLAQTEHYLGEVMTVLEREGAQRAVKVFSGEACGYNCPFRLHGSIRLSPSLRFVGTVNFDETTRLLSDRLLDRTNLIELQTSGLPSLAGSNPQARGAGPPVTVGEFEDWTSHDALPRELAGMLDQLRPHLVALGCGISPRSYRALCTFVASSNDFLSDGEAFDLQLAQRILSRLRHIHTSTQLDALDSIQKITEESAESQFDETLRILEVRRSDAVAQEWYDE